MNPDQPSTPQPTTTPEKPRVSHKKLGLWLIITPSALIFLGILVFLIIIFMPENAASRSDLFGAISPVKQVLNIVGFICTGLGFITWLPAMIIGIILLTRKK